MAVLLVALFLLDAMREQGIPNAPTRIQQLSWMAGCWQQLTPTGATIDEIWMPPAAETMLGMSRTVGSGRLIEYEYMRIQSDVSGVTFFAVLPRQSETAFRMIKMDPQSVVFE